jgi:tetratricopeptide (TPR) repeat protein
MKRSNIFYAMVLSTLVLVLLTYSNFFHNAFHFDDDHTIVNNAFIRQTKNIPQFFKSATTFSSLPANQTYRPMLTTLYAIDYSINGLDSFWFHLPVFIFYLLQGLLMYLVIVKVFDNTAPSELNKYLALFAIAWYMLNTANADVINYISASSDSISTFWVVAAMALYIYYPRLRKWFLYLIPVLIGTLFKQPALVFPGLLAVYCFLFENREEKTTLPQRLIKTGLIILPSLILSGILYKLQASLTSSSYITGGSPFNYIITQPFVTLHYFFTFFIPVGLSADSDWIAFTSISNYRFLVGLVFIVALVWIILRQLNNKKFAPIVFGLAWFLIALLPSALVPLSEVMNDYRAFFPYVGLVMAIVWALYLAWQKWFANGEYTRVLIVALVLVLLGNAYGTYSRNKVWKTEETLWHDVVVNSPGNMRGAMNYGLSQMNQGRYDTAVKYFQRTIDLMPYYSYGYINMGIAKAAQGFNDQADGYFKKGIQYGPDVPSVNYFYARYLHKNNRDDEALALLKHVISIAPADMDSRYLAMEIYVAKEDWESLNALAQETLRLVPGDAATTAYLQASLNKKGKIEELLAATQSSPTADNYINLSLAYYNHKDYDKCIEACMSALKINSKSAVAYNNMGSAYNAMGEWLRAEEAFKQALSITPDMQLAKNNLVFAANQQQLTDSLMMVVKKAPTADNYIGLSLLYYRQGLFSKMADACNELLKKYPDNVTGYNNLCVAYNSLQQWDNAIAAGERALQLDPNNQLARNNLAVAKQGKANSGK